MSHSLFILLGIALISHYFLKNSQPGRLFVGIEGLLVAMLTLGLSTFAVATFAATMTVLLMHAILSTQHPGYLHLPVFVLLASIIGLQLDKIISNLAPFLYAKRGLFFALLIGNSIGFFILNLDSGPSSLDWYINGLLLIIVFILFAALLASINHRQLPNFCRSPVIDCLLAAMLAVIGSGLVLHM